MAIRRHIPWVTALLALIIFPGTNYSLYAQPNPEAKLPYIWLNIGLGRGSDGGAGGLNLSIQPQSMRLLCTLRYCFTAEIDTDIRDVGVLVGYSSKRPGSRGYYSIGAGLGIVSGTTVDKTFGVPVEVQLFYTPLSFAGIGLQGFADFNKEETFYGVLLCLQFGKLR